MVPNKVKVAASEYSVKESQQMMADHGLYGQVMYYKNEIKIDNEMSEQRKEVVFTHELTHAIFFEAGYDEDDEEMVRRIGNVLHQVLRDNKFEFMRAE